MKEVNKQLNETNKQLNEKSENMTVEQSHILATIEILKPSATEKDMEKVVRILKEYNTTPYEIESFSENKKDYFEFHYAKGLLRFFMGNYNNRTYANQR